ncbi:MAG: hypothetical protein HY913_19010 [Desulfomonile tiedjei]|nr:hypothetical protein [Desulfomonile tiedjei]
MQNQVKFLLGVLLITALSLFLISDRGTSGPQNITSYDKAALQGRYHESEIVLPNGVLNPDGSGNWLLVAKKDDDNNGREAEEDEEEKDAKDSDAGGFDRRWDVACCG